MTFKANRKVTKEFDIFKPFDYIRLDDNKISYFDIALNKVKYVYNFDRNTVLMNSMLIEVEDYDRTKVKKEKIIYQPKKPKNKRYKKKVKLVTDFGEFTSINLAAKRLCKLTGRELPKTRSRLRCLSEKSESFNLYGYNIKYIEIYE